MSIKNLKINRKIGSLLVAGAIFSSGIGVCAGYTHVKDIRECDLESMPIEKLLENEEIKQNTTIDEEIEKENTNIIELDKEFRKHAEALTYDNYKHDFDYYVENYRWLKSNYPKIVKEIMFAAGKGAVSDALELDMSDIRFTPGSTDTMNHKVEYRNEYETYKFIDNDSRDLDFLIQEIMNVQGDYYSLDNAKDIQKAYDRAINLSNMVIAEGLNRHNDSLEPKYDKDYAKKNFLK